MNAVPGRPSHRPIAATIHIDGLPNTKTLRDFSNARIPPTLPFQVLAIQIADRDRIDVVIAVGTDQQQPVDRFLAQQEVEQAERGAAGPLQVVDEEHHRHMGLLARAQRLLGEAEAGDLLEIFAHRVRRDVVRAAGAGLALDIRVRLYQQAEKEAVRVFAESGYEGASIATVADNAGLSKQNLMYYFPTKQALYQRCLARARVPLN